MFIKLAVTSGPDRGRAFRMDEGETLVLGRSETSGTKLKDPAVSRFHCEIEVFDGQCTLNRTSSTSSVAVNGKKIENCKLKNGDVIRIGDTDLKFIMEGASPRLAPDASIALKPIDELKNNALTALVGQQFSHFRVDSVIAEGSSGNVFQATDMKSSRTVALKVLKPELSKIEDEVQRFVRAMKTMLPLKHPNIVQIYNAGKSGDHCWVAMELVEGPSMDTVIEEIGTAGMLDWRYSFRVAVHVGRALQLAAKHKIVHRSIAPQNILMRTEDKLVKLGDLMLAKAMEGSTAEQITRPGELIGDVCYMAPERTTAAKDIDGRSDIYGLGATVYAILTGRPPFEGSLAEAIQKIRIEAPIAPKEFQLSIPDGFQDIVLRMLAKDPVARYQSPDVLLSDLERFGNMQEINL